VDLRVITIRIANAVEASGGETAVRTKSMYHAPGVAVAHVSRGMTPLVSTPVVRVAARIVEDAEFVHSQLMQSALFYLVGFGTFFLVTGGLIAFFAMHNAPEGYEDENGFVGTTKGDESLLKEFGHDRHYPAVHRSMDLAA
jgi:hypothetical protein